MIRVKYILSVYFVLFATTALAQRPGIPTGSVTGIPQQPDQLEVQVATEWGSLQLSQQHFVAALTKLIEQVRSDKIAMDNERKYWSDYVAGLYAEKAKPPVTPK